MFSLSSTSLVFLVHAYVVRLYISVNQTYGWLLPAAQAALMKTKAGARRSNFQGHHGELGHYGELRSD